MNTNGQVLRSIVETVGPQFRGISDSHATAKPDPKKWSRKEILGHLIDSANNNQRRFVLANLQDDLVFDGYSQDDWVAIQGYQECSWRWIVDFWESYNLRIAEFVDRLPDETRLRRRKRHNLHELAWKAVPSHESTTLDYLIKDYIGHLEHHVRQILPEYEPVMIGNY